MKRITSIDSTRGLVMIIMALDHVRDFMHVNSLTQQPTDLNTTTVWLFLTRWITHLCAPTFVFLSGISAYISFKRKQDVAGSRRFLLSRGIWLIVLEFTLVNFALWFDIHFRTLIMEVICAIGAGFIVLSFLLKWRVSIIAVIGGIILFGHDLLQGISFAGHPALDFIASVLFRPNAVAFTPGLIFVVGYPLIPWLGILLLGFACGPLFDLDPEIRKKKLLQLGGAALSLFFLLRLSNVYGDPFKWMRQKTFSFTILSFINITKYPPSLLFSLATLGIMFLVLAFSEGVKNRVSNILTVYGRVPLFYFIVHLYLAHLIMFAMVFLQGFGPKDLVFGTLSFGRPQTGSGVGLLIIYLTWVGIVVFLYPLCKRYGEYKAAHPENKWLSYL